MITILGRLVLTVGFLVVLFLPAWWLAGRIQERGARPFFRLLLAIGLALVGHISFVNLLGRLTGHSTAPLLAWLALNALATLVLWRRAPAELSLSPVARTWRIWIDPVLVAMVLAVPQAALALSTPYWDEVASSAIHWTAVNQFAEDLFPPRHNAFPDVSIKYHYGVTLLSGTVKWLTGASANVSVDVVTVGLWLFAFLFTYFWLRELDFDPAPAAWGGAALLVGGGLSWLYLTRIETYAGVEKLPPPPALIHRYDPATGWFDNLIAAGAAPSAHLRNADGSLSNLPWDIAAQFQQHATALGIALTLVALYLFVTWQTRPAADRLRLFLNVVTFGVLFLAHGVYGAIAAMTAGLYLLGSWLLAPTRARLTRMLMFTAGVSALALLHGGLLAAGPEYGAGSDVLTWRAGFGYSAGGLLGFVNWNLAGFGLPLLLAIVGCAFHRRRGGRRIVDADVLFVVLTVFAALSYIVPHVAFYSTETSRVEQFTEILKFFFAAHLAIALLSVWGVARVLGSVHWTVLAPALVAMAVTPVTFCYANSVDQKRAWLGFYHSPYRGRVEQQMGEALRTLKKSNRDVYFDASADEARVGYLSEMLAFGGSVFTLTPSRFERTGVGFRLSESLVARRYVQNGRMARLLPGAAEACHCGWYYSRPMADLAFAPMIVRSRFARLVAERYVVPRAEAGARVLYSIDKPTADLDHRIEQYWRPRVVSQTKTDVDGDGKGDLMFYDYVNRRILAGDTTIDLPASPGDEFVQLYAGAFQGDERVDFLLGRLADTDYRQGKQINDIVEQNRWAWSYRDSATGGWQPEYERWFWDWDVPVLAALDRGRAAVHVAYRFRTGEWFRAPDRRLTGPVMDQHDLPLPFAGAFLEASGADLGLWSLRTGTITVQSMTGPQQATFAWGGPGDVLVPGDYTGDGLDEIAVWRRSDHTWRWRRVPDGPIFEAKFGTDTAVPLPADYNHDGRLDLAYWEPAERKIFVSFTHGRSIDLIVPVPANAIPAFVNML